jgi:hypothetical protein
MPIGDGVTLPGPKLSFYPALFAGESVADADASIVPALVLRETIADLSHEIGQDDVVRLGANVAGLCFSLHTRNLIDEAQRLLGYARAEGLLDQERLDSLIGAHGDAEIPLKSIPEWSQLRRTLLHVPLHMGLKIGTTPPPFEAILLDPPPKWRLSTLGTPARARKKPSAAERRADHPSSGTSVHPQAAR